MIMSTGGVRYINSPIIKYGKIINNRREIEWQNGITGIKIYDRNENCIFESYSDGIEYINEYDELNRLISSYENSNNHRKGRREVFIYEGDSNSYSRCDIYDENGILFL